jgi:hypothetical protein
MQAHRNAPASPARARFAALLALAAAVGAGQWARHWPGPHPRRSQQGMERLETSTAADRDWFRILSRDPARCAFEQFVRAGTPGFSPQVI